MNSPEDMAEDLIALRHQVAELKAEKQALMEEDRRAFDFLHRLGAATSVVHEGRPLHELIVEGSLMVIGATGGALYLLDETRGCLVPRYCSDGCRPLVDLGIREGEASWATVMSQLRVQSIPEDEGLLWHVVGLPGRHPMVHVADTTLEPLLKGICVGTEPTTAMVAGLVYDRRVLGVLIVTDQRHEVRFSEHDEAVFTTLAEQSAYALSNENAQKQLLAKKQMDDEMETACAVQRVLLPGRDPVLNGWVVVGRNRAARNLSGDFYEYVYPDEQSFGTAIADVSGKGFPAALVAATARSALQAHALGKSSPSVVLGAVNRQLAPDIRHDMFVTMIYLILEQGGSGLCYTRAGHSAPLIWRAASGKVDQIESSGIGIGIDDGGVFDRVAKDVQIQLAPGDVVLLYTDGVSEAMDSVGEEFNEERISDCLKASGPQGASAVLEHLLSSLDTFLRGKSSHDDVTVVAVQKL
jgi:phosphoserine phosphatase RsbU/P